MDSRLVDKYMRAVDRDVKYIDEAISKGARLSFEEWHDFVFKSEVAGFASKHISKYGAVSNKECEMARISAEIAAYIVTVQLNGFTDFSAQRVIKSIVKHYNKLIKMADRIRLMTSDADGVVTYVLESADMCSTVKGPINSRDSLCVFLQDMWFFMVNDIRIFNKETIKFLNNHMNKEICTIMSGAKPAPFIGCIRANTLEAVLYGKTSYEADKASNVKEGKGGRIKDLSTTENGDSKNRKNKKA